MTIYSRQDPPSGFYVYAYLRVDGTPYYIGKGTGQRAWKHTKNDMVNAPSDQSNIIILESSLTNLGACAIERRMILWYGRKDIIYTDRPPGVLRNKTEGGEGLSGVVRTEEWNKKIGAGNAGKTHTLAQNEQHRLRQIGKKQSDEHIANRAKSLTGRKRTPGERESISKGKIGIPQSPEHIAKRALALRGKKRGSPSIDMKEFMWIKLKV